MDHHSSIACIIPPVLLEELARRGGDEQRTRPCGPCRSTPRCAPPASTTRSSARPPTARPVLQSVKPGQAGAHDLRLPRAAARHATRSRCGARAAPRARTSPSTRRTTGWATPTASTGTVPARLDRRRRACPCTAWVHYGQRYDNAFWDGKRDGLRRRRRALRPLHQLARRHRPRAHARRDREGGRPAVPQPVRRAQRVDVRRVRLARQAVQARPDRRRGRLADRRGLSSSRASPARRCARWPRPARPTTRDKTRSPPT